KVGYDEQLVWASIATTDRPSRDCCADRHERDRPADRGSNYRRLPRRQDDGQARRADRARIRRLYPATTVAGLAPTVVRIVLVRLSVLRAALLRPHRLAAGRPSPGARQAGAAVRAAGSCHPGRWLRPKRRGQPHLKSYTKQWGKKTITAPLTRWFFF